MRISISEFEICSFSVKKWTKHIKTNTNTVNVSTIRNDIILLLLFGFMWTPMTNRNDFRDTHWIMVWSVFTQWHTVQMMYINSFQIDCLLVDDWVNFANYKSLILWIRVCLLLVSNRTVNLNSTLNPSYYNILMNVNHF